MSDNQNKFDKLFSETMPGHLRQSILQQAEISLAQNKRREVLLKFGFIFAGLATASVFGINISRKFFKFNKNDAQMAEWANLLASEDALAVAELSDEDLDLLSQLDSLEDLETISDDEFDFILKEDV